MGSEELPRAMTDCDNQGEGVRVGSKGLALTSLRFYPEALELFQVGWGLWVTLSCDLGARYRRPKP